MHKRIFGLDDSRLAGHYQFYVDAGASMLRLRKKSKIAADFVCRHLYFQKDKGYYWKYRWKL
jgi:hypothetical protein